MPGAGKLSDVHRDFIFWRTAHGDSAQEIADLLTAGATDPDGEELPPVDVTRHGVRYHQTSEKGAAAIEEWRERLYGDARAYKIARPGWRIAELEELYREARRNLQVAESPGEKRRWHREATRALEQAKQEMADATGKAAEHQAPEGQAAPAAGEATPDPGEVRRRCAELLHELDGADLLDLEPVPSVTTEADNDPRDPGRTD